MFGLEELKHTIKVSETTVECPVKGCAERVARQRGSFRRQEKFKCPRHGIYISPSTFEYQNELDNILWKEQVDLDLLDRVKRTKRESRLARDNSEDAVTWNVFRSLEKNELVSGFFAKLSKSAVKSPETIYWTYSLSQRSVWSPLQRARQEFEINPRKGSEPDIIVKSDESLFFVEAKLTADNNTILESQNPLVRQKYERGGDGWYTRVFRSSLETIAVFERKYELLRFWLLGSWIAMRLQLDFWLVNLVLAEQERKIEQLFGRHLKEDQHRKFVRVTWEDIYVHILDKSLPSREKDTLKGYFEGKTIGYGANGEVQKAFCHAFRCPPLTGQGFRDY